jgi:hypothetical protein
VLDKCKVYLLAELQLLLFNNGYYILLNSVRVLGPLLQPGQLERRVLLVQPEQLEQL